MIELAKVSRVMNWSAQKLTLHKRAASAKNRKVTRGHVYKCFLGENIGSEENKERPCLIIQNNVGNINSPNTIVAPITNSAGDPNVTVTIPTQFNPDGSILLSGHVLLGNIVTVSKARLGDYVTKLDKPQIDEVNKKLMVSIDIYKGYKKLEDKVQKDKTHIRNITQENYDLKQLINKVKHEVGVTTDADLLDKLSKIDFKQLNQ